MHVRLDTLGYTLTQERRWQYVREEPDGFKHPEKGKDRQFVAEYAIYENTVLLHEQIKEIRKTLDLLILKLERRAEDER